MRALKGVNTFTLQTVCDVLLVEELISLLFALVLKCSHLYVLVFCFGHRQESYGLGALQESRLNMLLWIRGVEKNT